MSARSLVALGATLAAASLALVAPAAQAAPTTLTVANPTPLAPPDGVPAGVSSAVAVSGQTGLITDVDVTLTGFTSTYPADLDVALVSPTGVSSLLLSGACGSEDVTNLTIKLDDAAAPLPSGSACSSGTFAPATTPTTGPGFPAVNHAGLRAFEGASPNGVWTLVVADHASPDPLTISGGFSLTFRLSDVTPPVLTLGKAPKPSPKATQKVTFSADEPSTTFTCAVDKGAAAPCTSPLKLKQLTVGKHKVVVTATDPAGNKSAPQTVTVKRTGRK